MSLTVRCTQMAQGGKSIPYDDVQAMFEVPDAEVPILTKAAGNLTQNMAKGGVDVEQLHNIKKNACSEDCSFCGQSAFFDTDVDTYSLPPADEVVARAAAARDQGALSYCLVAAWREPSGRDFERVCHVIERIRREVDIDIECSLGFLTPYQAQTLRRLGVKRYNHNLETAPSMFAKICTTHTFQDRLDTLRIAREAGLELCTGGIIGLGETRSQRMELALEIADICPEEVTINILVPVPGTPLELQAPLGSAEIARMFAILRFMLPQSIIKISGGRETATDDSGESLLAGGANGIITNGYLTVPGNTPDQDAAMIRKISLES